MPVAGLLLYGDKSPGTRDMAGLPAGAEASTSHILAHFVSSQRWYTGVAVANPGAVEAHITLTSYNDLGVMGETAIRAVPPLGKISEVVSGLFAAPNLGTGWIQVTSDQEVMAFDLYGDLVSGGIAALPSSSQSTSLVLPHFVQSNRWWTGLAILNPGTSSVSVTLKGIQTDGVLLDQKTYTVNGKCKKMGYVEDLLPGTANHAGWILVQASGPVAGLLIYGDKAATPNRIAAVVASPASQTVTLSSFFSDANWWTGIVLVNPDGVSAAHVSLSAYAPDGALIDSQSLTIDPHHKLLGFVSALLNLGVHTEGWVEVFSDAPVVGLEILNSDDAAREAWGLAAIESQSPGDVVSMVHHAITSRWWTLYALANPSPDTPAEANLVAYDNAGAASGAQIHTIPPRGRIADLVEKILGL